VYDGIQRKIRGNHIAIVDVARGGERCSIGDAEVFVNDTRRTNMETQIVTIGDVAVSVEKSGAAAVARLIARDAASTTTLQKKIKLVKIGDGKKKTAADMDDDDEDDEASAGDTDKVQACIDGLLARVGRLRKRVLGEDAISKMVEARSKTVLAAKSLMPALVMDGKSVVEIQREVLTSVIAKDEAKKNLVASVLDGVDLKTAADSVVQTAFNVVSAAGDGRKTGADVALALVGKTSAVVQVADAKPMGRAAFLANQSKHLTK
jgi:hypothetical protein